MAKRRFETLELNDGEFHHVGPEALEFDAQNPRLFRANVSHLDEDDLIIFLWKEMNVEEIALSVFSKGYFEHEPMLVIESEQYEDCFTVIEGNRRLAAVKLLLDESLQTRVRWEYGPPSSEVINDLREIPVVLTTREQAWQYIGFKHVNGPKPWDALAKAEYIARVHNDFDVPLEDIPRMIGDTHTTVKRLYRGLMVLRQAEDERLYDLDDRTNKRLFFSHLYTGLNYPGFQEFLGIKEENSYRPSPVRRKANKQNLGQLCVWLFGSREQGKKPLIRSQNPDLKRLDEALQSERGRDALTAGLPLDTAFEASIGDERRFREALVQAKVSLEQAVGKVHTGFNTKSDQLATASQILSLAESLHDTMELRQQSGQQNRRRRR